MASPGTAELWATPASRPSSLRLAMISNDETLAGRVLAALERDGLLVRLAAIEAPHPRATLVVIGYRADEGGAEQAVRRARRRLPDAGVIVILAGSGSSDAARLLSVGADALLLERDVDAAIATTVRAVRAGQVSVPSALRQLIQPAALSHRERQILGLAVAGLTNAQIAGRLVIAESTVKTHLSSAFRRLGVHSRREAAALVFASDEVLRRSVLATLRLSHTYSPQRDAP
jgi:DNA-binding NarL/FixJ family response regulator